jgi:hypothetical protein
MTTITHKTADATTRRGERIESRLLYAVLFTVFLIPAAVDRFIPGSWRFLGSSEANQKSIIGNANAAAKTATSFAFMG